MKLLTLSINLILSLLVVQSLMRKKRKGKPKYGKDLGPIFIDNPYMFMNEYSFSTRGLDGTTMKMINNEENGFDIVWSDRFKGNVLEFDQEGPIRGYFLPTKGTITVDVEQGTLKPVFIFTSELTGCTLMWNISGGKITIYHQFTTYTGENISDASMQEMSSYKCHWGFSDVFPTEEFNHSDSIGRIPAVTPFFYYSTSDQSWQLIYQKLYYTSTQNIYKEQNGEKILLKRGEIGITDYFEKAAFVNTRTKCPKKVK